MITVISRVRAPERAPLAFALAAALGVSVLPGLAAAATYVVTDPGDAGNGTCAVNSCTLRDAVAAATSGSDTITFASSLSGDTIVLDIAGKGHIGIGHSLTIAGPGASKLTVSGGGIASNSSGGILSASGGTLTISGITLANGNTGTGLSNRHGGALYASGVLNLNYAAVVSNTAGGYGGGFYHHGTGAVTVSHSTISGNSAGGGIGSGGGFASGKKLSSLYGPVYVIDSTISNNTVGGLYSGGGFFANTGSSPIVVSNSTITGNTCGGCQGANGIFLMNRYTSGFTNTLTNSIVANNNAANGWQINGLGEPSSSTGVFINASHSLISQSAAGIVTNWTDPSNITGSFANPALGALANNGGPTQTQAIQPGSPVIGRGLNCQPTDQRGVARPSTGTCDMGAYDYIEIFYNGFELSP